MIKSNSDILSLPKLYEIELNTPKSRIKSELTIEKFNNKQKKTDNLSEFTNVSSLGSINQKIKKNSKNEILKNLSRRLCFSNYIPLKIYGNQTLLSNWFEDRLRLDDKINYLSRNSSTNNNLEIKKKTEHTCFSIKIEIDHKIFILGPQFLKFLNLNMCKKMNSTLYNRETSKSFLRFFKVINGRIENDLEPINYSDNLCILTCDRKYCLTSGNDFLDREISTGLLNVNFVLVDDRIGEKSIWKIEPKESKNDTRMVLEKYNTPVDQHDLIMIKNYMTNKYICVVMRNLRPVVVLDRLYSRIKQNIYWKIENFH